MTTATGRRPTNPLEKGVEAFASSRVGGWWRANVAMPIDRRLLPLTRGRVSVAVGQPVGLLETVAKSGERRQTPLRFLERGDDVVLVASKGSARKQPAWFTHLKAHPRVRFLAPHRTGEYVARVVSAAERDRLWPDVAALHEGGRTDASVVVLERAPGATAP
jgi:deazaflavin-dependent oxidoreductase (nitroreductase family)